MPRARKSDASIPSQVRWCKQYLAALPKMIEEGRVTRDHAVQMAKGYRYVIHWGEKSLADYRTSKREADKQAYEEADKLLR